MRIVEEWCKESGLSVNPEKSNLVRFTLKRKNIKVDNVKLFDKIMHLSNEVKYLGIFLDSKLSMKSHFDNIKKKATKTLWASRALVKRTWGLRPNIMSWIYTQILSPRITYGEKSR